MGGFETLDSETGLLFYSNSYHEFSVTGAVATEITGINATGIIVGDYELSGKIYVGFVFNGHVLLAIGTGGGEG